MEIDFEKLEQLAKRDGDEFASEVKAMWMEEINRKTKGLPDIRVKDYTAGFDLAAHWFLKFLEHYYQKQETANAEWRVIIGNLIKRQ